ncbi:MAG: Rpp14/Pop5 family protein [Nanoarchaeota archaeon]
MKLLPSLKQKKRYIVFEILSSKKFSFPEIKEEVEATLLLFFGQWGLAKSSPLIIKEKFNPEKQRFVIKINHKFIDELKAALTLSKKIKNTPVIIKSVITSGTLKKASSYL